MINQSTATLKEANGNRSSSDTPKAKTYRFDIFKGEKNENGKVTRVKSLGAAHFVEGRATYTLYLKTFINEVFYLLPDNSKIPVPGKNFVILTREESTIPGKRFFWNNVGSGQILDGVNAGFVKLNWDIFATDIFLNLYPNDSSFEAESIQFLKNVLKFQ